MTMELVQQQQHQQSLEIHSSEPIKSMISAGRSSSDDSSERTFGSCITEATVSSDQSQTSILSEEEEVEDYSEPVHVLAVSPRDALEAPVDAALPESRTTEPRQQRRGSISDQSQTSILSEEGVVEDCEEPVHVLAVGSRDALEAPVDAALPESWTTEPRQQRSGSISDQSQTSILSEEGVVEDCEEPVHVLAVSSRAALEAPVDKALPESWTTEPRQQRSGSILKQRRSSEASFIKDSSRSWKCLPKPDLTKLNRAISESIPETIDNIKNSSCNVRFSKVQIRSYNQTVGDNPSVSYGSPIQLDWEYEVHEPLDLDLYEGTRAPRRKLRQMILSFYQRRNILTWQYGVPEEELKLAKKNAKKIQFERSVTLTLLPIMHVEAAFESAGRKARRTINKKTSRTTTTSSS